MSIRFGTRPAPPPGNASRGRPPAVFRAAFAVSLAILALSAGGCASTVAYRDAEKAERREHWDVAVLAYQRAVDLEPDNQKYRLALQRAKLRAARAHFERGKLHRTAGQLDLAAVELEQAVALDPTNDSAVQEHKRTLAALEARKAEALGGTAIEKAKSKTRGARAAPPMLSPASDKPIDLVFPTDTPIKKIYGFLASAAGINIIYDPQLKDDKYTLDLRGVSFQKGLETAMRQAGHFYKVIDEKTILVAQDTNQNRKEYEDLVIRTFFLSNGDVKDVSAMVRSILDLRRLGTIPQLNAIVIRDTADKVAVAERIIDVNDKAKSEVVIDVELLQLNTKKAQELGASLSAYSTGGSLARNPRTGDTPSAAITSVPWQDLFKIGITDFNFSVPGIVFSFIKNNSDAEVLAKPQLRIAEGEKAQLVIGDRVPIPVTTVNTQQAIGGTGVIPITSFQYQDVGIKIDMEPRVHHNKEVTLKLTVEVSNLNGSVKQNGQEQPIIGTRTISSTIRLKDGETNFLAGLIRTDKSHSRTTLPFLGDLPILGRLFSSDKDDYSRTDLFLTLTPHIVRSPQITEEDLTPIWVGTENNVSFSGLATRLESPNAPGSPFDGAPEAPSPLKSVSPGTPAGAPPVVPLERRNPAANLPVIQGSGPSDPFKRSDPPPKKGNARDGGDVGSAVAPALSLTSAAPELGAGKSSVVSLNGLDGLAGLTALELTVEWDPSVVEVLGIAPGPWSDQPANAVRFEADRVPGRARLQFGKKTRDAGLPSGVMAELAVKGLAPGTTVFRVSAAAAAGANGGVRPTAEALNLTVTP